MKHLEYKGYSGTIDFSKQDKLLFGKVRGMRSLLSYEGSAEVELEADFTYAIDEYLNDCKMLNTKSENPY
jgi:predicted HicB family RNase H-like nuclease